MSLEQKFLEELKAKNQAVAVFLVNGIKLQGVITLMMKRFYC